METSLKEAIIKSEGKIIELPDKARKFLSQKLETKSLRESNLFIFQSHIKFGTKQDMESFVNQYSSSQNSGNSAGRASSATPKAEKSLEAQQKIKEKMFMRIGQMENDESMSSDIEGSDDDDEEFKKIQSFKNLWHSNTLREINERKVSLSNGLDVLKNGLQTNSLHDIFRFAMKEKMKKQQNVKKHKAIKALFGKKIKKDVMQKGNLQGFLNFGNTKKSQPEKEGLLTAILKNQTNQPQKNQIKPLLGLLEYQKDTSGTGVKKGLGLFAKKPKQSLRKILEVRDIKTTELEAFIQNSQVEIQYNSLFLTCQNRFTNNFEVQHNLVQDQYDFK